MKRKFLTDYLYECGCNPDEDEDSHVSELWRNCINGETCYIPFDEDLVLTTYCHVLYELKVDPPEGYESDYDVYSGWRNNQLKEVVSNLGNDKPSLGKN